LVNIKYGGKIQEIEDMDTATEEEKAAVLDWSYDYNCLLISSCIFDPTTKKKVWVDGDDVMENCPTDSFEFLRDHLNEHKFLINKGTAKK
jgi:hypothetical protein